MEPVKSSKVFPHSPLPVGKQKNKNKILLFQKILHLAGKIKPAGFRQTHINNRKVDVTVSPTVQNSQEIIIELDGTSKFEEKNNAILQLFADDFDQRIHDDDLSFVLEKSIDDLLHEKKKVPFSADVKTHLEVLKKYVNDKIKQYDLIVQIFQNKKFRNNLKALKSIRKKLENQKSGDVYHYVVKSAQENKQYVKEGLMEDLLTEKAKQKKDAVFCNLFHKDVSRVNVKFYDNQGNVLFDIKQLDQKNLLQDVENQLRKIMPDATNEHLYLLSLLMSQSLGNVCASEYYQKGMLPMLFPGMHETLTVQYSQDQKSHHVNTEFHQQQDGSWEIKYYDKTGTAMIDVYSTENMATMSSITAKNIQKEATLSLPKNGQAEDLEVAEIISQMDIPSDHLT